jgi:type 1 glutamine amidotransferase
MERSVRRERPAGRLLRQALATALALWGAGCTAEPGPGPEPGPRARVLLVTGEDYPGHDWQRTTPVVAGLLERDPRLEVEVLDDLRALQPARLEGHDVVVLHFKNYDPAVPGRPDLDALRAFVAGGGGLVLLHFAGGAFQEFRADFTELAGRTWDPGLRGHDPRGRFRVEVVDRAHAATAGLEDFETDDELYTCLAGEVPIEVLAEARSTVDGRRYPMAFVLGYGAGRVFHTPLGHDVAAFDPPGVGELIRRGSAWAAGLPTVPTRPIPRPPANMR